MSQARWTGHIPTVFLMAAAAALTSQVAPARAPDASRLPFEVRGLRGPIRGAVVLDGDRIAEVVVDGSVEGPDGGALANAAALAGYAGQPARPPVLVDAVAGATLSSRRLRDAVNGCLAAAVEASREAPP